MSDKPVVDALLAAIHANAEASQRAAGTDQMPGVGENAREFAAAAKHLAEAVQALGLHAVE